MRKLLILVWFFVLAGLSTAATKSYEFLLPMPVRAGDVMLAAGQYRLRVEGSTVVITNVRNQATYSVPVRVESASGPPSAVIEMKIAIAKRAGVVRIASIELEDTNTTLEF